MGNDFVDHRVWVDLIVFVILGFVHSAAWFGTKCSQEGHVKLACFEIQCQRNDRIKVNNEAVAQAAQAGVTGLGILIAASFVVLQLTRESDSPLPRGVATDVFFAGLWLLGALSFGFWVIWRLAMFPKGHDRVVLDVGIMFGLQLLASVIGVARLIISVAGIIWNQ